MQTHSVSPPRTSAAPLSAIDLEVSAAIRVAVETRTGAELIWETLVGEGVEVVFGYPGGAIMPAYDALPRYPIRHVLVRHEQSAGHMADGFARASGNVGVAIATSGPGATNLVTAIATAKMDSVPLVCITGQVPAHLLGTDAFQEIDIIGITAPITKYNVQVRRASDIPCALRQAFHIARSGRPGPVLVDITKDAQFGSAAFEPPLGSPTRPLEQANSTPTSPTRPLEQANSTPLVASASAPTDAIGRALRLIGAAQRPLLIAGHGVTIARAHDALRAFAEQLQMPVASTLLGIGALPASHPLSLGMAGMHGQPWVNQAIQEADLIVAVGMRFDDRVTGDTARFAPRARKIHIEVDPREINKNIVVDVGIVGDARQVLEALLLGLPRADAPKASAWVRHIDELRAETARRDIVNRPDDGHFYAAHVIHDLSRITLGRALVVTDVGQHQMWEAQYYQHERPRSLLTSGGLGTMGFALPAAIGARISRAHDEIWVIAGDGGFQMTAAELATIAQENIKLNIAIINNGYLGMVRQQQEMFYGGRYVATPIGSPDFVSLGRAHGLDGARVSRRADLPEAVERARRCPTTFLLDFRVEPEDAVYPTVPGGADLGSMIRRPLVE